MDQVFKLSYGIFIPTDPSSTNLWRRDELRCLEGDDRLETIPASTPAGRIKNITSSSETTTHRNYATIDISKKLTKIKATFSSLLEAAWSHFCGESMRSDQSKQDNRMAQCSCGGTKCKRQRKAEIIYKDCVIIGNGPSAISLSYLLSGHRPYYNGDPLADEYLQMRLNDEPHLSLLEQDLEYLSDGLEGRSTNPVALLYDMLAHPNADLGIQTPAALEWRADGTKIDHVVLGKGRPGGVWQKLDGSVNTLSISHWMELPNMPFKQWMQNRSRGASLDVAAPVHDRATIADVSDYYTSYIHRHHLRQNFLDDHVVTSVHKILDSDAEVDCDSGECRITADCRKSVYWEVCGKNDDQVFCFRTKNVVLAVGSHDQPNKLRVPGEHLPYVMHSVQDLQNTIKTNHLTKPVMIVGAGLSAADAIATAQNAGLDIIHVFRRKASDPEIVFRQLPSSQFPEYHQIHEMMMGTRTKENYEPYQEHVVKEFLPDGHVMIYDKNDTYSVPKILQTSAVVVLIGSKPDLGFLCKGGRHLGVVANNKIDSKHNPMDVNPYTYESEVEPGLFGLGALVGDNFVRFLQGGCLAICKRLTENHAKKTNFD